MPEITLRDAAPDDVGAILAMIRELATFENEPDAVEATEADLLRDGFGAVPRFQCRLAELDGRVCGFALWFFNYSTWVGRAGLYLEDFYVRPWARRHGVGERLLRDLARIAVEHQAGRLDLNVLAWNPARQFYERLGIRHLDSWLPDRIAGAALRRFARGADQGPGATDEA
jgi:GNAT superfamily N-acetyltransferase